MQTLRDILAWLIELIWKREKAKMATITIDGIAFPISDFEEAIVALRDGLKAGQSGSQLAESIGKSSLPVIETLANYFCPGLGTGIELLDFIATHGTPFWKLSQEDQNKMQSGGIGGQ